MVTRRWWVLGTALVLTVVAAVYEPAPDTAADGAGEEREAGAAVAGGRSMARRSAVEPLELPARRFEERPLANLFAVGRRQAPSAPVVVAPQAPPLPFRYLGRLQEGGQTVVFLGQGPRTHLVREGETVAEYRAEAIGLHGMTLVYLPLNEKQPLTFGSQN